MIHKTPKYVHVNSLYRRGYRLYNKLCGRFAIKDSDEKATRANWVRPLRDGPHHDMPHVGAVLLEGWISA
jgi:hypothetical protein